jgi:inward rectifier potassium channel
MPETPEIKHLHKENEDLGLGEKVIQENQSRFVNPDGSFNVYRKGMFERGAFSPYHAILNKSWTAFYAYILGAYALANFIFSGLYILAGRGALSEVLPMGPLGRFGEIFFFSIQILTTLGSSSIHPVTVLAKTVFALEAMTGILGFSVGAGLIFARLSNPATKIIFSRQAVVAPYKEGSAFMMRMINGRSNELVEMSATLTLAMTDPDGKRAFHQLPLERSTVLVFPLNWTIVHAITKESPLYGLTADDLARSQAEFLVGVTGNDQDLSKRVYARHSYLFNEVVFGAKFSNIIERSSNGTVVVDPKRIHEIEQAALPGSSR